MDIKSQKSNFRDFAIAATPSQKVTLVDYSDSEEEDNDCPMKVSEDDLFNQIQCCLDFETLQFFVLSGAWVGNVLVQKAIQSQYDQLDPDGVH